MIDRIEKTVDIAAPVERVWRALIDSVEFGTWFRVKMETGFVVGQTARGRITHPGYKHLVWEAKVVAIEPPHRFAFSWRPYAIDPAVDYSAEEPTLVEFHLAPTVGGTRLVVTESGFDRVPAHRRDEALRMNDSGWAQQVLNIKAHVESEPHPFAANPAPVFAALGDPTRLALLMRLSDGQARSIAALSADTVMTRQAVTKHLHVLEEAGLVASSRRGRESRFRSRPETLAGARDYLDMVSARWDEALDRLKTLVEG